MDYFLDTNVELGYVFCTDPWNTPAVTVFDSKDKLHYSKRVDGEFQKNFIKFSKEQKQFFFRICDELESLGLKKIGYNEFNSIGLDVDLIHDFAENKKEKCLEVLWKISNKNDGDKIQVKILVRKIRFFARNFDKFVFKRKNNFERKVMLCPDRFEEYSEIFEELSDLGIHEEDNNIILDAHDLASKELLNLNFVTSDNNVYELPQRVSALNISEFIHLRSFG